MSRAYQSAARMHQPTAVHRIDSRGEQIANQDSGMSGDSGGNGSFSNAGRVIGFQAINERTTVLDQNEAVTVPTVFSRHEANAESYPQPLEFPAEPRFRAPVATFVALQEWEGYVVEIHETEFQARLVDITADSRSDEEDASIPLAEISDDDARRMKVGSIFRWVIGYERSAIRPKKRVSQIVFRDLPAVTKTDMHDGEEWAQRVIQTINP